MLEDLADKIRASRGECLKIVAQVNEQKEKEDRERKLRQEEERKAALEKELSPYLQEIPVLMEKAAKEGKKVFRIRILSYEIVRNYNTIPNTLIPKVYSATDRLVNYLKSEFSFVVKIVVETTHDSGAYNEVLTFDEYYLEISY